MPETPADPTTPARLHRLRSGTAARLAGLPASTLRVWERRYGVVATSKAGGVHRSYTLHDVSRLKLLRHLTQTGHAIGTVARLDLDALQALVEGSSALMQAVPAQTLGAVVVGRSAASALEAVPGCVLLAVHDDLDQAEVAPRPSVPVELLLVRLASLQPLAVERVLALGAALRAQAVLVVYAFGTEASARSLRDAGAAVQREPLSGHALAQWVRARRSASATPAQRPAGSSEWAIEARRFSDEALARLATQPSPVACECQRHMAEIVAQLAAFERYSQDCISTGPADAALHRHLSRTAGAARTLFEQALHRVVTETGLVPGNEPAR